METLDEYNVTMGGDVGALFAALAKAQGQMGAAKKTAAEDIAAGEKRLQKMEELER